MMDNQTSDELKAHVKDTSVWKRLFFIILFTILYSAAEVVVAAVVLFQFLTLLLTGNKNDKVLTFGAQLSTYAYQIFQYLTFNSDTKPFPMNDWPSGKPLAEEEEKTKRAPRKPAAKKPAARKAPVKKVAPKAEEKSDDVVSENDKPAEDKTNKPD